MWKLLCSKSRGEDQPGWLASGAGALACAEPPGSASGTHFKLTAGKYSPRSSRVHQPR